MSGLPWGRRKFPENRTALEVVSRSNFTAELQAFVESDSGSQSGLQAQIEKILASRQFSPSQRHGRLLRYLVNAALEGRAGELKEYVLGVEVFQRGESFDPLSDAIVRTELSRFRAKLKAYYETEGRLDPIVIDLPNRSYSLTAQRREASEKQPVPSDPVKARKFQLNPIAIALGVLVVCGALYGLTRLTANPAPRPPVGADLESVAVLPFVTRGSDADLEQFSDGLTEELIHCLGEIDGLRVLSRTSAFRLKDKQQDARSIGSILNVDVILEGTVERSGGRLRIRTRLVKAREDRQIFSKVYDREPGDLFALQREIARQVAKALQSRKDGEEVARFTKNGEAYRYYLQGLYHANRQTEGELIQAIDSYQNATQLDPNYAPAFAYMADAYICLALMGDTTPRDALRHAEDAARQAIRSGDSLSHSHSALASVLALYKWDWAGAEKEFRRAIELDPNDAGIRQQYAMRFLTPMGDLDSATFELRLARQLDPLSPQVEMDFGKVLYYKGEAAQAIKAFQIANELDRGFESVPLAVAAAYIADARIDEAVKTLESSSGATEDEARLAMLGHAYGLARQPERARHVLEQLSVVARHEFVSGYYFALLHLALGETADALASLEKAADDNCPLLVYLKVDPGFNTLRSERRFRALLVRLGL